MGFTLVEMLVVLGIVMLLAGALLGIGKYMTVRAQVQLCESQLEVIGTALEQYYEAYETFPAAASGYDWAALKTSINGTVIPESNLPVDGASSTALFYFLDQNVNSRKIIQALSGDLLTNKDRAGAILKLRPTGGAVDGSDDTDLPRFIDPWDQSIRYEYVSGGAFPRLTSAGPDKAFNTADDITSP